jgi:hypothetical protein
VNSDYRSVLSLKHIHNNNVVHSAITPFTLSTHNNDVVHTTIIRFTPLPHGFIIRFCCLREKSLNHSGSSVFRVETHFIFLCSHSLSCDSHLMHLMNGLTNALIQILTASVVLAILFIDLLALIIAFKYVE